MIKKKVLTQEQIAEKLDYLRRQRDGLKTPQVDETGALVTNDDGEVITPHDYIVKKVAKSLNSVSVAISKVTVSG